MLLTASVVCSAFGQTPDSGRETLAAVASRDAKVVRRWQLPGDPRGVALGADGTIYAGLAQPQAIVAIDPNSGAVKKRIILDSADIASTKELVTLRTNADRTRLYVANGSDESATILSLPDLAVLREITMEGEAIRDALPDPRNKRLYLLGRRVHVFDIDGETELRTLDIAEPMAIAATANGASLAVLAPEDFGNAKATVVAMFDTTTFAELTRDPLQTEAVVEGAFFADNDRALVAWSRENLYEKPLTVKSAAKLENAPNGTMRMKIDFGDLVNSDRVCMPEKSGAQIVVATSSTSLVYAERRCSASGAFSGSGRHVTPASLYGVSAYALAYDAKTNTLVATEPAGFLIIYKVPRAAQTK